MKYIMMQSGDRKIPIIFPDMLIHQDVFLALKQIPQLENAEVVSAGGITIDVCAVGDDSSSLKVQSKPEDEDIIEFWDQKRGL